MYNVFDKFAQVLSMNNLSLGTYSTVSILSLDMTCVHLHVTFPILSRSKVKVRKGLRFKRVFMGVSYIYSTMIS